MKYVRNVTVRVKDDTDLPIEWILSNLLGYELTIDVWHGGRNRGEVTLVIGGSIQ